MTDARTLRLAHPDVPPDRLERFLDYQRALLKALLETSGDDWAGRFAFGHAKALKVSGLDGLEQKQIAQAAQAWCGRRSAAVTVKQRIDELQTRRQQLDAKEAALLEKAPVELERLADLSDLQELYGPVTLASFAAREVELLELHRAVAHAEGKGHIH